MILLNGVVNWAVPCIMGTHSITHPLNSMRKKITLTCLILVLLLTACQPATAVTPPTPIPPPTVSPTPTTTPEAQQRRIPRDFVGAQGTEFVLNGQPFRFGGANNHEMPWLTDGEMEQVLADASQLNFHVMRTFASVIIGQPDGAQTIWEYPAGETRGVWFQAWDPASQTMLINDSPNGLVRLDALLAAASRHNVRLIIALVDNWYYYGGTPQYCAWRNIPYKRWCPAFYTDPAIKADFKTWVSTLLHRTNTITGIAYRDDPTIFAWQLANEPAAETEILLEWADEMTTLIRAHDPNHLISFGDTGFGRSPADFARLMAAPNIDFGTLHLYPAYQQPATSPEECDQIMRQYLAIAQTANKPVVLEEFGLSAAAGDQTEAYRSWTETMRITAHSGWLVWRLLGRRPDGQFPPQDNEGFNLYNDDSAITRLLSDAAHLIHITP